MNDQRPPSEYYPDEPPVESGTTGPPQGAYYESSFTRPVVTYAILGLTIGVFTLQFLSQAFLPYDLVTALGIKENSLIAQGQIWRLFTPMLLHGSILHLGFNMYALYIFGPGLERYYGHYRYAGLYIISGFAGNVLSLLFTESPSLGASTAIFGLLGAQGVFLYQNRGLFGSQARRALNRLIFLGVVNIAFGLSAPQIDNWGHIGGLLGGILYAWFAGPVLEVKGQYPALVVVDSRDIRAVVLTGVTVGAFFALLAAASIFL